ncbi:MAG: hypothetical protein QXF23_06590 [Candidatus Bathyarchaeia archaeon]
MHSPLWDSGDPDVTSIKVNLAPPHAYELVYTHAYVEESFNKQLLELRFSAFDEPLTSNPLGFLLA